MVKWANRTKNEIQTRPIHNKIFAIFVVLLFFLANNLENNIVQTYITQNTIVFHWEREKLQMLICCQTKNSCNSF